MAKQNSKSKTKVDKIVAFLRQAILRGDIAPGEWLRQDELAERFGISPTPVREAFRRLEAERLVEHIAHRGVRAVAYDLSVAQEYYDLRALLEPYAVQRAAGRLERADLAELETMLSQAQQHLENNDLVKLTEVNWLFHDYLVGKCGSRLVQDVLAYVRRSFQLDTLLFLPERAIASLDEHRAIYTALERGDASKAAEGMRINIENARAAMFARLPRLARVESQLDSATLSY